MDYSSNLLKKAVEALSTLPGVGRKSALRFALHLMDQPQEHVDSFIEDIRQFKSRLRKCQQCGHLTEEIICEICTDPRRDRTVICVVESIRDVLAIEATNQYFGLYHILGGIISPIDGVGPQDLTIDQLIERCGSDEVHEVILAIRPSIEGDTTAYYIARQIDDLDQVRCSMIARGVAFGGELEYTDEVTLGRSIESRLPYHPGVSVRG